MRKKLKEIKETLMKRRHTPVPEQGQWVRSVIRGYFAYFAVPGTAENLGAFRKHVGRLWFRALRRRSQRKGRRLTWERFKRLIETWVPKVEILHPYPNIGLAVK
jgi:hypothetical protein